MAPAGLCSHAAAELILSLRRVRTAQGSTSTFTTSSFSHNEAQKDGGAIYFQSSAKMDPVSSCTLKFCSFNGNAINSTNGKGCVPMLGNTLALR
jgi:predicted outer membrane repeat protein